MNFKTITDISEVREGDIVTSVIKLDAAEYTTTGPAKQETFDYPGYLRVCGFRLDSENVNFLFAKREIVSQPLPTHSGSVIFIHESRMGVYDPPAVAVHDGGSSFPWVLNGADDYLDSKDIKKWQEAQVVAKGDVINAG